LPKAYGLEKSTTSEHFVEASRRKLNELMRRILKDIPLTAMLVGGTIFKGQHLIMAIGIDRLGNTVVLGLRQGAVENAAVVQDLFGELVERGIDFNQPRLYLLDGSKALRTAVIAYAGDAAFIQRCQAHRIRNVAEYLPEAKRHAVKFRMRAAREMEEPADARNALYKLHGNSSKIHGHRHMPVLVKALEAAHRNGRRSPCGLRVHSLFNGNPDILLNRKCKPPAGYNVRRRLWPASLRR